MSKQRKKSQAGRGVSRDHHARACVGCRRDNVARHGGP
jgi:hypothetical protein